jgi:minor histocompatibility antigen H13
MVSVEPIFIAYGALILMAVIPIYFGCRQAVRSAAAEDAEQLSKEDAYLFPVFGSIALLGVYLVFRYLPREYVDYFLNAHFIPIGVGAVGKVLDGVFEALLPTGLARLGAHELTLMRSHDRKLKLKLSLTWPCILAHALAAVTMALYFVSGKHWIVSNVLAMSVAGTAITAIHLDSFLTGAILLAGLFVYDVFWVFGTDVMVSVAKNFNLPIKVLFPRNIYELMSAPPKAASPESWSFGGLKELLSLGFASFAKTASSSDPAALPAPKFTMLGLGDIVVPGLFIALCLRFDLHRSHYFPIYFVSCLVAYLMGLLVTVTVMHTFQAAQPALLYLSPACICMPLAVAACRHELAALVKFTTDPPAPSSDKKTN